MSIRGAWTIRLENFGNPRGRSPQRRLASNTRLWRSITDRLPPTTGIIHFNRRNACYRSPLGVKGPASPAEPAISEGQESLEKECRHRRGRERPRGLERGSNQRVRFRLRLLLYQAINRSSHAPVPQWSRRRARFGRAVHARHCGRRKPEETTSQEVTAYAQSR